MAKITIPNITSGYLSTAALNAVFDSLETELNSKVLYRDNPVGEPNQMEDSIDMNSNRILNVANAVALTDAVNLGQVQNLVANVTEAPPLTAGDISITQTVTTATAGQTVFTIPEYTPNVRQLAVYRNGQRQYPGTAYTESSSTTVTMVDPADDGDVFLFSTNQQAGVGASAALTNTDVTNFNNNLSAADDTVQKALETLDELASGNPYLVVNTTPVPSLPIVNSIQSIALGDGSVATGQRALALGTQSSATGDEGTAIGQNAVAGQAAHAMGSYTTASGVLSLASGYGSNATATGSTAFGSSASSTHTSSTAIGRNAATTAANQVRLGTASETVSVPGTLSVEKTIVEGVVSLIADEIDMTAGSIFRRTLTGDATLTLTNLTVGGSFTLEVTNGGVARQITFGTGFSGVLVWPGGTQPTETTGVDVYTFFCPVAGVLRGALVASYTA